MSIRSIGVLEIFILEHIGTRIYRYQNVLILGQLGTGKYGYNTIGDIWVQYNWGHMCKVRFIVWWFYYLNQLYMLLYTYVPYCIIPIFPVPNCPSINTFWYLYILVPICSSIHISSTPIELILINPSTQMFLYPYDPQLSFSPTYFLVPPAPPLTDFTLIKEKL